MIHKIEKLVSVGKFRNYQAAGQVNFHKLNLIYGDNGGGKTTLTSVLRSLNTNTPEIIRSRISTNHTAPQAAQIIESGTPPISHSFGTAGWSNNLQNLEIFDIHFISDNIYSGFEFTDDHKKQLHQFVIGAQGIAIQQQIDQNKADKSASTTLQGTLEQDIITQTGNNLSSAMMTAFLGMPISNAANVAQLIADAGTALTNANSNAIIQTLPILSSLAIVNPSIDFDALVADLQATTDTIQNDTLKALYASHCKDLGGNAIVSPENWLEQGFDYIKSKKETQAENSPIHCPFCKQGVADNLEILVAYTTLFNENFKTLVARVQSHLNDIQSFNLDSAILLLNSNSQTNETSVASWTTHLPAGVTAPVYSIIDSESALRAEYAAILSVLQQKAQNPSIAVSVESAKTFQVSIQRINDNITTYNQLVTAYNVGISTFKLAIQSVPAAQAELDRLKRIQKRFEAPIDALCTQLSAEKLRHRGLQSAYTTLSTAQDAVATAFFATYKTRINHYLGTVFKTLFQIDDVVHIAPQGRATHSKIGYKLTIDGKDISFAPNQPFSARECLSEGDKSTIALAFFLSKLDIDPNRQDKILVFDDPLSSLDTNRRTYTIGIIRKLLPLMKQIIVLSHNEYFLHEIGKDFGAAEKKELRITENFAAKASILEVCDLNELVKNDYFKHIEALESFRITPNHAIKDTVLGWLRNVLEAHLRFKFYMEIRPMTGMKTFGRLITFLDTASVVFRDNANRASIIDNLKLINSVSWVPHHGTPAPDFATIGMNPATITASELDHLIQDTLNLINSQL